MRVLHATDVRHFPLIVRHGLFAGAGRSSCVPDTPAGRAAIERLVAEGGRRGGPAAALAFEAAADEVEPADDPSGDGLALARRPPGLPPRLLSRIRAIEPEGRRMAAAFLEWERAHALRWLDPGRLDRAATLEVNAALAQGGALSPGTLETVRRALAERRGARALPVAALSVTTVLGLTAAFLLFSGRDEGRPVGPRGVYRKHCAGCHGEAGRGDGLEARLTLLRVPDMTDPARMASFTDEYLYTVIAKGSAALGGTAAMPGWDHVLTPDEIRAQVAHIRGFSRPAR